MSFNVRNLCLLSTVVLGSLIAVRVAGTSSAPVLDDPPIRVAAPKRAELRDDALAEAIHRFATLAPGAIEPRLASR
jgi:hypothetical protein